MKNMRIKHIHLLILAGLSMGMGLRAQHVLDQTVATELLRGSTKNLAIGALQQDESFLRQYSASVLEQELAQEAGRRGLPERMDVRRALQVNRTRILVEALKADVVRDVTPPTAEEVEAMYEQASEQLRIAEALRVDLYVLDAEDPAANDFVSAAVDENEINGEKISEITGRQLASAENGGGWVARNSFPEGVWNELEAGKDGQVFSFPLEGNILLIKRHEYRDERQATMEEARDQLRVAMMQKRQQAKWVEFLQESHRKIGFSE